MSEMGDPMTDPFNGEALGDPDGELGTDSTGVGGQSGRTDEGVESTGWFLLSLFKNFFFFVVEAADNKLECLNLANLFQVSLIFMGTYGRVGCSTQVSNKFYILIQTFPFMQIIDCHKKTLL